MTADRLTEIKARVAKQYGYEKGDMFSDLQYALGLIPNGEWVPASDYDGVVAERDLLRAENLDLHEQLSAIKSPEVCAAAHDNVDDCGYCQRDRLAGQLKALHDTRDHELRYLDEVLVNIRKQDGEAARESANDTLAWLRNRRAALEGSK